MNIFAVSSSPIISAQQLIDKHIVKMPTESCQMLHTNSLYFLFVSEHRREPTLRELKEFHKEPHHQHFMKPAMLNHPSTIWARKNKANYMWLYHHAIALCKEYTFRYGKEHGSQKRISQSLIYLDYDLYELTPIDIAMDDRYRLDREQYFIDNPDYTDWDYVIDCYRNYYLEGKWRFAEWRKDRRPDWFPANHIAKKYNLSVRKYNATNPKFPMRLLEE